MSLPVRSGAGFEWENPRRLFGDVYVQTRLGRQYDVAPDGSRFLMIRPVTGASNGLGAASNEIHIVQNWFEELRRRVPTH
jgi:hypothetical protein